MSESNAVSAHNRIVAAQESFDDLYVRHASAAMKLALVLTGNRNAAEDLVQEAFVRLLGRFRDRRHPDAFDKYLRATIVNLARTRWRRDNRRPPSALHTAVVSDHAPSVALSEVLWQRVTQLPPRQRAAVFLRYYEDRPLREIAECLGCSLAAAKSLLRNALLHLRQHEKEVHDE